MTEQRAILRREMRFQSGLVLPEGCAITIERVPGTEGAIGHYRDDPQKWGGHAFGLADDDFMLLVSGKDGTPMTETWEIPSDPPKEVTKLDRLSAAVETYNHVSGHFLPSGEFCLMLSHRVTMDHAVLIRVREESDVLEFYSEADEEAIETINTGGDWPS